MAKRTLKPYHQEDIRAKIQGIQLVRMLRDYALTGAYLGVKVDGKRVEAAVALLRKVIPDLQSSELTVKSDSYADELQRIADILLKRQAQEQRPDQPVPEAEQHQVH